MRRRGFGSIDVSKLAQAQFAGQLQEGYVSLQYQPNYEPGLQPWPLQEATQGFAQQVAQLLGGSAVQVPGNQLQNLPGSNYPSVWAVSLPGGGVVDPAQLFPAGVILSYPDECTAETSLVSQIPGAVLSSACAGGGTGMTPTQLAVSQGATAPVLPGGQSTIVGYTPPAPPPAAAQTSSSSSGKGRTGAAPVSSPPAGSQVVTGTPGASVAPSASSSGDLMLGGWDVTQAAEGLPWWGWAIGAGVVLFMFASMGGRH